MNRDKRTANILALFYSALSLLVLSLPLAAPVQAFRAGVSYLIHPAPFYGARLAERLAGVPASAVRLISADVENLRLRENLKRLPLVESELESLRRENKRLKAEMGLKPARGRVLRWASVIERDPLNWYRHLMVDAGREEGVEVNAPVLGLLEGRLGAVGRVIEVGPFGSKVLLASDETSSLASYIPEKQWEGLVEGQGGPFLRMNYLPPNARIVIGDSVYTSPTSVTFPPDILVGYISRVLKQDPFLTFQGVEVAPAIVSSALKEVLILSPQKAVEAGPES